MSENSDAQICTTPITNDTNNQGELIVFTQPIKLLKYGFLATTALGSALALEGNAFANSSIAGYSGKAFFDSDSSCFGPNATAAQNNCSTSRYFAVYPVTSDQFTSGQSLTVSVFSPSTLTTCRVDIYSNFSLSYSSGFQSPATGGAGGSTSAIHRLDTAMFRRWSATFRKTDRCGLSRSPKSILVRKRRFTRTPRDPRRAH